MIRIYDNGIYRDATPKEMQALALTPSQGIEVCKAQLASTDYQCLKYAEGELTEDEYAPIKKLRKQLRKQINELEDRLEQDV